jgi:hypothetical protein
VAGGAEAGRAIAKAIGKLDPLNPDRIIPDLLAVRPVIRRLGDHDKLRQLDDAIALCAGLWLDATADRYDVIPGESVKVKLTALDRSRFPIASVKAKVGAIDADVSVKPLPYNQPAEATVTYPIVRDHPYSQPFWLAKPKTGDTYTIDDQRLIGRPDSPPALEVHFRIVAGGTEMEFTRPVQYRYTDRVQGDLTRPLVVVPPVAVNMTESVRVFPAAEKRPIHVAVQANKAGAEGVVKMDLPAGWTAQPPAGRFKLAQKGEQQDLLFEVTPRDGIETSQLRAIATVDGRSIDRGMEVISYPHIPVQTSFPPAAEKLVRADIRVLAKKVGYIVGAGDDVPHALEQLGCEITFLSTADLEQRNLQEFDAIVAGVRAYNVRADLVANEHRLLDYVKNGGTYIVQYNTVDRGSLPPMGPYPFAVTMDFQTRHDRVSVEDAPVKFPHPANPLLHKPNEITGRDFDGWVQERGLYFASKWDPHYETVLECNDPGEPPNQGGMLYTRYGKGVYIFSAYSWFRQLPAGVPGAYRIFANMLSAARTQ